MPPEFRRALQPIVGTLVVVTPDASQRLRFQHYSGVRMQGIVCLGNLDRLLRNGAVGAVVDSGRVTANRARRVRQAPQESAMHLRYAELSRDFMWLDYEPHEYVEIGRDRQGTYRQGYDNLNCSREFNRLNFEPVEYTDEKGEARSMVKMTKNGFVMLVMGFTGKAAMAFEEAYIAASTPWRPTSPSISSRCGSACMRTMPDNSVDANVWPLHVDLQRRSVTRRAPA